MSDEDRMEWLRLPQDLQHRFFELAGTEAERLSRTIKEVRRQLEGLRERLAHCIDPLPSSTPTIRVGAVDSSRSPRLSERLGVRYGVFASGITYIKGEEREEVFRAGVFKRRQALSQEKSKAFFDLLTSYIERKLALEALSKAEVVLIDGSFFGFLYAATRMKKEGLYADEEERLVREVFNDTKKLLDSGRSLGIVKRSHTRALGGYLALQGGAMPLPSIIDKLILSLLMPERSFFDYHRLLGERPVQLYTYLARLKEAGWEEGAWEEAEAKIRRPFEVLGFDAGEIDALRRIQVRAFEGPPPCEIEYTSKIGVRRVLDWVGQEGFFNEATNLPIALDLVDDSISLSARFTDEFVSEVEGRVLELLQGEESREAVKLFFALLNPQKPF